MECIIERFRDIVSFRLTRLLSNETDDEGNPHSCVTLFQNQQLPRMYRVDTCIQITCRSIFYVQTYSDTKYVRQYNLTVIQATQGGVLLILCVYYDHVCRTRSQPRKSHSLAQASRNRTPINVCFFHTHYFVLISDWTGHPLQHHNIVLINA